ncbi:class I SAM-dependent methyltransferase [Tenacibaculum maritimum]
MIDKISKLLDILLLPFIIPAAFTLKFVRRLGLNRLPFTRKMLVKIGVIPIINHYYDPFFSEKDLQKPLNEERSLMGIDWNINEQLALLKSFSFSNEFSEIPDDYKNDLSFHFNNGSFCSGDAEYWYNMIRLKQPKKIIEIGSGHSTKIAQKAILKNKELNLEYNCLHTCIEPYEMPWLEKLNINVIREKVENIELSFFKTLEEGDILFIDSSHIIKPQGDVLFEYFEILPILNKGVIVHIHDIFSPRNYLKEWVIDTHRLWNEQYLLEAF